MESSFKPLFYILTLKKEIGHRFLEFKYFKIRKKSIGPSTDRFLLGYHLDSSFSLI
jgi:hypothetical protein